MKKAALILLVFLKFVPVKAQDTGLRDSIEQVLATAKTDTATCFHLLRWVSNLNTSEHETAVRVSTWVVQAAKKNAVPLCQAQAWYSLGRCYETVYEYKKALVYFKKADEMAQKHGFYGLQGKLYSAYGNIYSACKQYKLASEYYYKAIYVLRSHGLNNDLPVMYFNLASLLYEQKTDSNHVQQALANIKGALATANEEVYYDVVAYSLWLKSLIYFEQFNSDSAHYFIDQAYAVANKHGLTDFYSAYYSSKALMQKTKGHYNEAMLLYEQGLKEAEKARSHLWQYNFYGEMASLAALKGDYKNAFAYHQQYKTHYDSVVNAGNFAKLNDLQTQLTLEKKERDKQKSVLLLQQSEQRQQNLWVLVISIGVVLVVLSFLIVVMVRTARARRQAYIKLQQKNIEIQEQGEQLARLSAEINKYQAQMNPHFVFNALNSIQGFVVNNEKEKTLQQLGNFSKLMRTTLHHSNHELITLKSEIDYLRTYMAFEQERFRNTITFDVKLGVDENETLIPPMLIQPLLENALKHARLGDVPHAVISLQIAQNSGALKVTVTDNGKGIVGNLHEVVQKSHAMSIIRSRIGLAFEREQKELPQNYFTITSLPPGGTKIEFYLPVMTEF